MSYDEFINSRGKFLYYKHQVESVTRAQPLCNLEHYDKRGLSGVDGAYHLDHIISIKSGYENNIPAHVIGNIRNLRYIPWRDNLSKGSKQTQESDDMFIYLIEEGIYD